MASSRQQETVRPQGIPQGVILLVRLARRLGPSACVAPECTRRNWAARRKVGFPEEVNTPPLILGPRKESEVRGSKGCLVPAGVLRRCLCPSTGKGRGVSLLSARGRADDEDSLSIVPCAGNTSLSALGTCRGFQITLPKRSANNSSAGDLSVAYPLSPLSTCEACLGTARNSNHGALLSNPGSGIPKDGGGRGFGLLWVRKGA